MPPEENFSKANSLWDMERLYVDLSNANGGKSLSPNAKKFLMGILCQYSPQQIAQKCNYGGKDPSQTVRQYLSREVYTAIKTLLNLPGEEVINWKNITQLLKDYQKDISIDIEKFCEELKLRSKEDLQLEKNQTTKFLIHQEISNYFLEIDLLEHNKKTPLPQEVIKTSDLGSQLEDPTEDEKRISYDHFLEQVVVQGKTPKSQGKRIVIIGQPGLGKTTLLQKIGDKLIENNKILIWISLNKIGSKSLKDYLFEDWLKNIERTTNTPSPEWKAALEESLKRGQVCLLLDGADEMVASLPLQEIQRKTQSEPGFSRLLESVQIILTCRSNSWERYPLDNFDCYRVLNFKYPDDVEQFIDKFFGQSEAGQERGKNLKLELRQSNKSRIRDLVKNPLFLSLLCYTYEFYTGRLPNTKARLYELFVKNFYQIRERKLLSVSYDKQEQLRQALGELAKKALDNEKCSFLLPSNFIEFEANLGNPDDENSLFYLAKQVGWLKYVGHSTSDDDAYTFMHSTFQEYFAATVIPNWKYFLPSTCSVEKKYRIFDNQWQEVILFWVGVQHTNDQITKASFAQDFILKLINFEDATGLHIYWYRAYFLAARLVSECPELEQSIIQEILNFILTLSLGLKARRLAPALESFEEQLVKQSNELISRLDSPVLDAEILEVIIQNDNWYSFQKSIELIRQCSLHKFELVNRMQISLNNERFSVWKKQDIAATLLIINSKNEAAIEYLEKVLENGDNLSLNIIRLLGTIDKPSQAIINLLKNCLNSPNVSDQLLQVQAAYSLSKLDPCNNNIVISVYTKLERSTEEIKRKESYHKFRRLGISLVDQIVNPIEDEKMRNIAFKVFKNICFDNLEAEERFCNILECNEDEVVICEAATNLSYYININRNNPNTHKIQDSLLKCFEKRKNNYKLGRLLATEIAKIDEIQEIGLDYLCKILLNQELTQFHGATAYNIRNIVIREDIWRDRVNDGLIALIDHTQDKFAQMQAAYSLYKLNFHYKKTCFTLRNILISDDTNEFTRRLAAEYLCEVNPTLYEECLNHLFQILESTIKIYFRKSIAGTIIKITKNKEQWQQLLSRLKNTRSVPQKTETNMSVSKIPESYNMLLWQCAQNLEYNNFLMIWNPAHFEQVFQDIGKTLEQLKPTNNTYPIPIDIQSLEDETDKAAIAQELCNEIYQIVFPNEDIPEVTNPPQLKRLLPKINKKLKTTKIALILHDCKPNSELIEFCKKVMPKLIHIAFITEEKIEPPLKRFSHQENLISAIQSWLSKL